MAPAHPSVGEHLVVSFPAPKTLCLRINRPKALGAMNDAMEADLCKMLDWAEEAPGIWVIVITGTGRAFCAGADLKAWDSTQGSEASPTAKMTSNPHGFGSIARRRSKKVYIAALNGMAHGGGCELLLNCDIVIGAEGAAISLPEVRRGVVASVGGIPNLMIRAPQLAPYMLTGTVMPPHLLKQFIFTDVVPSDKVMPTALDWANKVVQCSPDAVWVSKEQINLFKDGKGLQNIVNESLESERAQATYSGFNIKEGLRAFVEKRSPEWRDPPKLSKPKL